MPVAHKIHGNTRRGRTCARCHREKDKYNDFYAPEDNHCIACHPDVNFIKSMRKLVRDKGVNALKEKIEDYERRLSLCMEVVAEMVKETT